MRISTPSKLAVFLGCAALMTTPVAANASSPASVGAASNSAAQSTPREFRNLVGQNYGVAAGQMRDREFTLIENHNDKYRNNHSYWWSERRDDCIHLTVYRGNVVDVANASDRDCNRGGNGDAAAAVGVVAGVAILGALLSKKHHKKDKEYDDEGTIEFERGFRDGLHHAQYHNTNRTDAYSEGYTAGVEQREANLSHHTGGSGYQPDARYADLIGARASAVDQLGSRGFSQVDNFTSGNTRYGIWYRARSRQCIQVVVADGRLENITDIKTHPKCR